MLRLSWDGQDLFAFDFDLWLVLVLKNLLYSIIEADDRLVVRVQLLWLIPRRDPLKPPSRTPIL
jgi:hypothetical protein